jgi:hypothetical protein
MRILHKLFAISTQWVRALHCATAYFSQSLLLPPNKYNWSLWIAIAWSEYFCIHMHLCVCA